MYPQKHLTLTVTKAVGSGKLLNHNIQQNFLTFFGVFYWGVVTQILALSVKAAQLLLLGNSMSNLKAASLWNWNVPSLFAVEHQEAIDWLLNGIKSITAVLQVSLTSIMDIMADIRVQGRKNSCGGYHTNLWKCAMPQSKEILEDNGKTYQCSPGGKTF